MNKLLPATAIFPLKGEKNVLDSPQLRSPLVVFLPHLDAKTALAPEECPGGLCACAKARGDFDDMKFLRVSALAGLASLSCLAASAETNVPPGLWSYDASAALGPIPMREQGTHCVDGEMAAASYESLFNDINPNCRVTDGRETGDVYHFTLACAGGTDGELTGKLTVEGNEASLNATGWTGTNGSRVPVLLSASAKKLAPACS